MKNIDQSHDAYIGVCGNGNATNKKRKELGTIIPGKDAHAKNKTTNQAKI